MNNNPFAGSTHYREEEDEAEGIELAPSDTS